MNATDAYQVIEVPSGAATRIEQIGTKEKFWFRSEDGRSLLFKQVPALQEGNTGEDWAEKVASELSDLVGLPHVRYELARHEGERGVICESCVPPDGRLMLGNELLAKLDKQCEQTQRYHAAQHSLLRVLAVLDRVRFRTRERGEHQISRPSDGTQL